MGVSNISLLWNTLVLFVRRSSTEDFSRRRCHLPSEVLAMNVKLGYRDNSNNLQPVEHKGSLLNTSSLSLSLSLYSYPAVSFIQDASLPKLYAQVVVRLCLGIVSVWAFSHFRSGVRNGECVPLPLLLFR